MIAEMREHLSPLQAALRIGVSPQTVKTWAKQGRIPALRTPVGLLFAIADVEEAGRLRTEALMHRARTERRRPGREAKRLLADAIE